ncbi:Transcriptional regulator, Crp/Fnr family [hydrothermal vent metagenome]|uniref:Transcriptional regulator, Crp/Fnr family n=1 Tax=hydrothermal vent metagenome TaxID=652676 RepID=A0A3B0VRZ0_9ZZZZ
MSILNFLAQKSVKTIQVPKFAQVSQAGDDCEYLIVLTKGSVKVSTTSEEGKSITLYYIYSGESCVLTASSIMNHQPFNACATTQDDSEGYMIPKQQVLSWLKTEPQWQNFMFGLLEKRMGELLNKVNQLAFNSLESRLLHWISQHPSDTTLEMTHQTIAEELASSREVISRLLKKLEQQGHVKLYRGKIIIL